MKLMNFHKFESINLDLIGISKSVPIVPSYRAPAATERLNTTTDSKASNTNYGKRILDKRYTEF